MNHGRRHLIISPIGDASVHRSWLSDPEARTFDLMLIYYGANGEFGRDDADIYLRRQGFKYELLAHVLAEMPEVLSRYQHIWCPDNDIAADTQSVNRLFALFEHYRLQLAQPAVAAGDVSYKALRQKPGVILRYTPYVEVMCPLFSHAGLLRVAPTFSENRSGWGLDWIWPRWFAPHERAIIDAVGVAHTGELFCGEHYRKLAQLGIHPQQDFQRMLRKYGGFDRRTHKRFLRGTVRLPAIRDPQAPRNFLRRAADRLGWRRAVA
jgi:hypothetical protein